MHSARTRTEPRGRTPRLAVALPESTRSWVDQVAVCTSQPPAATAASLIDTLAGLLRAELRRIPLRVAEAAALSQVLNSTTGVDLAVIPMRLFVEASEAFDLAHQIPGGQAAYGTVFDIDENNLLEKLRRLGPTSDLALRLALAQVRQQNVKSPPKTTEAFADHYRAVGLTIIDPTTEK